MVELRNTYGLFIMLSALLVLLSIAVYFTSFMSGESVEIVRNSSGALNLNTTNFTTVVRTALG